MGYLGLLLWVAVILKTKHQRELAGLERALCNCLDDVSGRELVDHRVSVRDVGLLLAIPEVELYTPGNRLTNMNK